MLGLRPATSIKRLVAKTGAVIIVDVINEPVTRPSHSGVGVRTA